MIDIGLYIIYTPDLEFAITIFDWEKEYYYFRGGTEGAPREQS